MPPSRVQRVGRPAERRPRTRSARLRHAAERATRETQGTPPQTGQSYVGAGRAPAPGLRSTAPTLARGGARRRTRRKGVMLAVAGQASAADPARFARAWE